MATVQDQYVFFRLQEEPDAISACGTARWTWSTNSTSLRVWVVTLSDPTSIANSHRQVDKVGANAGNVYAETVSGNEFVWEVGNVAAGDRVQLTVQYSSSLAPGKSSLFSIAACGQSTSISSRPDAAAQPTSTAANSSPSTMGGVNSDSDATTAQVQSGGSVFSVTQIVDNGASSARSSDPSSTTIQGSGSGLSAAASPGISSGAIAGIAVGIVAVVAIILGVVLFRRRRSRRLVRPPVGFAVDDDPKETAAPFATPFATSRPTTTAPSSNIFGTHDEDSLYTVEPALSSSYLSPGPGSDTGPPSSWRGSSVAPSMRGRGQPYFDPTRNASAITSPTSVGDEPEALLPPTYDPVWGEDFVDGSQWGDASEWDYQSQSQRAESERGHGPPSSGK
jgi:hypothetical protein